MSKIQIVPSQTSGKLVTPYENSDKGYVKLVQEIMTTDISGWLKTEKRTYLVKGPVKALENYVSEKAANKLQVEGALFIHEFVESELPELYTEKFFNKELTYEENVSNFAKRAGSEGPMLTKDGERILRFTVYSPDGSNADMKVDHDNVDAVRAFNNARKSSAVNLPQ